MATWNRTIAKSGSVELIVKKSRFICTVDRAGSEAEARAKLQALKKQYWDANHNCSAWILGDRGELRRSNDDGEPGGTAGAPMLHVLDQRGVTDTIAVVTRYFGGILLGAGGIGAGVWAVCLECDRRGGDRGAGATDGGGGGSGT